MLRGCAVCAAMLLAGNASAAQRPPALNAAVKAYDAAQLSGDRTMLERLLADDYLLVNSSGQTETRAQFIKDLTDPQFKQNPFAVDQAVERIWADGAVMGGITTLSGTDHGSPFSARLRFADIWARRNGRWQVVYTQVSKAP